MARIAGVDLPKDKRIEVGLQYVFGVGPFIARQILSKTGVDPNTRVNQLSDADVAKLRSVIETDYTVEGNLRGEISMNIKRLIDIGSYRGLRHRRGLPVRGQRTKTNARTRKGPRRSVGGLKKKAPAAK
ncbi:MAG: 30S ribosomal protein S13 [candidate division Zixibacteria bacterium]|nr:30S ribosomal protein S13 [candidate division Zixibacteria bacterium]